MQAIAKKEALKNSGFNRIELQNTHLDSVDP